MNIVGGLKLEDLSTDVAVALAIASSFAERPTPNDMAFFGEVGLGGELRPVAQSERRVAEAATMGFKRVIMPRGALPGLGKKQGVEVVLCATLADAIREALGVEPSAAPRARRTAAPRARRRQVKRRRVEVFYEGMIPE